MDKHFSSRSKAWVIWGLAAAFFFFEYVVRVSPSVMAEQLINDFDITALSLGMLSVYFYYAYVVMQVPVGAMLDKFGVRWLIALMALLCSVSCWMFASTTTFQLAELSRLFIGISGAFAFVGALKLASTWFPANRFGFLAGTTQALGMLGASVGAGPLSVAVENVGWRLTLQSLGWLILILAIAIVLVVRDKPAEKVEGSAEFKVRPKAWQGIKVVLSNPLTWLNGLFVGLLYAPTGAFGELWGPLYMQRVYGFDPEHAASVISMVFVGWAIGGPFFGWVSDLIKRRRIIMLGSAVFSLIFMLMLLYLPGLPLPVMFVIAFLYGLSNIGVSTCYAAACEMNPREWSGISLGFTNMASIIIGASFQPIIGWLLDLGWEGQMAGASRFYSRANFETSMIALPICLVVCIIIGLFIKETYGLNQKEEKVLSN